VLSRSTGPARPEDGGSVSFHAEPGQTLGLHSFPSIRSHVTVFADATPACSARPPALLVKCDFYANEPLSPNAGGSSGPAAADLRLERPARARGLNVATSSIAHGRVLSAWKEKKTYSGKTFEMGQH